MQSGGKKVIKTEKTKSKKTENEQNFFKPLRPKQKDKSLRRLMKEEKEYVV
jgi:hypothetical protein